MNELDIEKVRDLVRRMLTVDQTDPVLALEKIADIHQYIESHGWKMVRTLNSHMVYRAQRGHKALLARPRRQFQVVTAYVNRANEHLFVHYHTNNEPTKRAALAQIS